MVWCERVKVQDPGPKGPLKPKSLYKRRWRAVRARRSFMKRCQCWKEECDRCMRSLQARLSQLDHMTARGWGDTPQDEIPPRWRKLWGPDQKFRRDLQPRGKQLNDCC